jgi:hypothetical protein
MGWRWRWGWWIFKRNWTSYWWYVQKEEEVVSEKINENKLSISRAIRNMDAIIDSLSEGKKKLLEQR